MKIKRFLFRLIISDLEKIADYLVYIKQAILYSEGYCDDIKEKYFIVKGDNKDLDDELNQLLLYKEEKAYRLCWFYKTWSNI